MDGCRWARGAALRGTNVNARQLPRCLALSVRVMTSVVDKDAVHEAGLRPFARLARGMRRNSAYARAAGNRALADRRDPSVEERRQFRRWIHHLFSKP